MPRHMSIHDKITTAITVFSLTTALKMLGGLIMMDVPPPVETALTYSRMRDSDKH